MQVDLPYRNSIPPIKNFVIYLLRAVILVAALIYGEQAVLGRQLAAIGATRLQLIVLGQLDLVHVLTYDVLPAVILILFTIAPKKQKIHWMLLLPAALGLGALSAYLLIHETVWIRPNLKPDFLSAALALWVGTNVALFIWFHLGNRWRKKTALLVRRSIGLSDLLFPPLVWSASRPTKAGWIFAPLRVFPALVIGALPIIIILNASMALPRLGLFDPAFRWVHKGQDYQVIVDRGSVILTDDRKAEKADIIRLDPRHPNNLASAKVDVGMLQAVALDEASRNVVYVAPDEKSVYLYDADTLQLRRTLTLDRHIKEQVCRTMWAPEQQLLLSFCGMGTVLLCPNGRSVISYYPRGEPGDAVIDPANGVVHEALIHGSTYGSGLLVALDGRTLSLKRALSVPRAPERLAYDASTDRLFVTFPVFGRLLVLEASSYRVIQWVKTFPGVRAITIDAQDRWLFLGGFSSFLEVRSLDDYSLVDRLRAPPYCRWIAIDNENRVAYVTSGDLTTVGLWAIDLDRIGKDAAAVWWKRRDPFFPLLDDLSAALQRWMGWDTRDAPLMPVNPRIFPDADCSGPVWNSNSEDRADKGAIEN